MPKKGTSWQWGVRKSNQNKFSEGITSPWLQNLSRKLKSLQFVAEWNFHFPRCDLTASRRNVAVEMRQRFQLWSNIDINGSISKRWNSGVKMYNFQGNSYQSPFQNTPKHGGWTVHTFILFGIKHVFLDKVGQTSKIGCFSLQDAVSLMAVGTFCPFDSFLWLSLSKICK